MMARIYYVLYFCLPVQSKEEYFKEKELLREKNAPFPLTCFIRVLRKLRKFYYFKFDLEKETTAYALEYT